MLSLGHVRSELNRLEFSNTLLVSEIVGGGRGGGREPFSLQKPVLELI